MASEVAARILEEGLISRQELSEALADSSSTGCIVARIVDRGADADQVLALFDEFGPPVGPIALAGAPMDLVIQLPAAIAQSFFALPVAQGDGFIVVAMADPSHRHAIDELERVLRQPIQPRPARVGDLRQALIRSYPEHVAGFQPALDEEEEVVPQDEVPVQLLRPKRTRQNEVPKLDAVPLTSIKPRAEAPDKASLILEEEEEEAEAVPLNRPKGPPVERPSRPARRFRRPVEPVEENSWADLDRAVDRDATPNSTEAQVELGPLLAAIRDAQTRDEVMVATADAASRFSRSAVVLTLRRGVLRGAEAGGEGVSTDAIRNLWIPATSPSMFRTVVDAKDVYRGPFGGSAADHLYRAAIGSRGGNVEIHPIDVQGTVIAVLCADDPTPDPTVSLGVIAHAMGEALTQMVKG